MANFRLATVLCFAVFLDFSAATNSDSNMMHEVRRPSINNLFYRTRIRKPVVPIPLMNQPRIQNRVFSCPSAYGTYPHEEFCNLYYECHESTAFLFKCPFDWLFDSSMRLCDFPKNVDCNGLTISSPGPNTPTPTAVVTDGTTSSTPAWTTRPPPTTAEVTDALTTQTIRTTPGPFHCPPTDGIYPNPTDCSSFYQCVAGTSFLQECPDGTNFNPETTQCELGDEFCDEKQNGKKNHILMREELETTVSEEPETSSTTKAPVATPSTWFECPEPEGDFVSPYNCSVYFQCTNGLPWEVVCPDGLWFDTNLGRCNWAAQVDCQAHPTSSLALHRPRVILPELEEQVLANESIPEEEEELEETTIVEEGTSVTFSTAVTPVNWFECPGSGLFPDPYDCHSYINCVFDNAWLLECPSDYLFDPISLTCKPPGQVTCTEISGEPTVRPTEPTFTVQPGYVCEEDGLFPYEPSCHYYYQCANTIPYLRPCSANLIFDPKKKRCVTVAEADLESLTCELNPTLDRISSRLLIALKKSFVRGVRIRPEIRKPSSETSRIAANHAGPQTPKRNH